MNLSTFTRRLESLNNTASKLFSKSTYGMTNTQRDAHESKINRNGDAIRALCQKVDEETYNASEATRDLCCDWAEWQE